MPTPVGHTLLGLTVYAGWTRNIAKRFTEWKIILWVIFCANLPDFDLFAGLLDGNLSKYHQTYTHTLGFSLLVCILTFAVLKAVKAKNCVRISVLTFLVLFSHVILDTLNYDTRPPIGVPLLWPFSSKSISIFPVFYAVPHTYFSDIISSPFILAVIREIMFLTVPLLLVIAVKLKLGHEKE